MSGRNSRFSAARGAPGGAAGRVSRRSVLAGLAAGAWPGTPMAASATPLKIGVMSDMSGSYAAFSGKGSILAATMACEDIRRDNALPFEVEVLSADFQMKPDIALSIARSWLNQDVRAIIDVPNTSAAVAIHGLLRGSGTALLASGSERLTGRNCSPNTVQWAFDLWSLAHGTTSATVRGGGRTWFFVTADYAAGHTVETFMADFVVEAGGRVMGHTLPPLGTTDFSSYLLHAKNSGADVVALVVGGADLANAIKQASEFGVTAGGCRIVAPIVFISDIHALGLQVAQGLTFTTAYDGSLGPAQLAFAKRFAARNGGAFPTQIHAGVYASTLHYLKAVSVAGTSDAREVVPTMKRLPTDDPLFGVGSIRADGRHIHPMFVVRVKRPDESKGEWDYVELVETIPAIDAVRPLAAGQCMLR